MKYVVPYFQNTQQLTQAIETKALHYLEKGYQQELTYKHSDGSFSAFGSSDPSGSTWYDLLKNNNHSKN